MAPITILRRGLFRLTVQSNFIEQRFCVAIIFGYRKKLRFRKSGIHDPPSKICCLTVPKKIVREPPWVQKRFWVRKVSRIRGAGRLSRLSVEIFLSQNTERFRRRIPLCFENILVADDFMDESGEDYHKFQTEIICLTVPNHFSKETFCVSESFCCRKNSWIREGWLRSTLKFFCRAVPKKIVEECFCVSKHFWYQKFLWVKGEGGVSRFSVFFCLTVQKSFVGEPFRVSEKFWCRKIIWIRGGMEYHEIPSNICCLTLPKKKVAQPFWVAKNFWYRTTSRIRGAGSAIGYHDFPSKHFWVRVTNFS